MHTTFLSGGRPIRLEVHEPATPGPHPALLLLHGAGGNTGFWLDRIAPSIASFGVAVYAVHYFDRTGTVRADPATITDGRHVPLWLATLHDTVAHLRERSAVDPNRIALVGISLGAFLSLALATEEPGIRAIVELSGGIVGPYEAHATASFPPTLIIHGEADTVVPVSHAHALDQTLTRLGVQHQTLLLPDEGHWFSHTAQHSILTAVSAFLAQHLKTEPQCPSCSSS